MRSSSSATESLAWGRAGDPARGGSVQKQPTPCQICTCRGLFYGEVRRGIKWRPGCKSPQRPPGGTVPRRAPRGVPGPLPLFLRVAPLFNMAPPGAASPAGENGRRLPGAADFRRRPISWRAALKHRPPCSEGAAAATARPSRPASAACPRRQPAA